GARPLQGAVHRRWSGLEHLSDLGRREPEHVAEDQSSALLGGHALQAGDKGQCDGLTRVITSFGAESDVNHQSVGIGLEPRRFIRRYGERGSWFGRGNLWSAGGVSEVVEASVR